MPLEDSLSNIPVIGQIAGLIRRSGSGPRSRADTADLTERLRQLGVTFPHEEGHVLVPPVPSVGTTTEDSTLTGTTSPPSSPVASGETDRQRRRRERQEERARLNRRTNVSIMSSLQTGLGIFSQISALARTRTTPGIVGAAMAFPPASVTIPSNIVRGSMGLLPVPQPGSGARTVGGFGGGPATQLGMGPPSGFHFAKDGSGKIVRNRTMNVLNLSAAKRAIRRIKGARKVLRSIESSLPKRASSASKRKR